MNPKWRFSAGYIVLAVVLMIAAQIWLGNPRVPTLAYSEFKALLHAGRVHDLAIGTETIAGKLDLSGAEGLVSPETRQAIERQGGQHSFEVTRMADPNLVTELETAKVRYAVVAENHWLPALLSWIVPAILFAALWMFILRRAGRGVGDMMSVGKSNAKVYVQNNLDVRFTDVEGIDEAKEELIEVVDFLRNPDRYRRLGGRIPKGVLIVGAPGTGKTLLAKAVAGEAQVPFLSMSGSEFVEMFVGVGAARVRDLFHQAEQLAPCIIFIDELDALGKTRGAGGWGGHEEREQTLNQLLVEMDGFDTNKGVIMMAATNRPEILDPALLRPGRFDRHVAIDRPDIKGREKILKLHAKRLTLGSDVDLAAVAAKTPGFAGADLANIVNEAALRAARGDKQAVTMNDFEAAIDRALTGLEKKNRVMNPKEKETVAYHEAGHALVAEFRETADRVAKISIIPRGIGALGFTQQVPTEDRYLLKYGELLDKLDVLLGGRIAEQLIFGELSTGAQNDLQRATDLVRHMVTKYGMSEALGPVVLDSAPAPLFLGDQYQAPRIDCSEHTAQRIDDETRQLLSAAEDRVRVTLTSHRAQLESVAKLLLRQETIDRDTFRQLIDQGSRETLPVAVGL